MKARRVLILMASLGLAMGLMTGCGGSSNQGDDNGGGIPVKPAGLNNAKVNATATKLATTLGCDYTPVTAQASATVNMILPYQTIEKVKTLMVQKDMVFRMKEAVRTTKQDTQVTPGSCGGTLTTITNTIEGKGGTIDLIFDHYCDDKQVGTKTVVDGSVHTEISQSTNQTVVQVSTSKPLNIKSTNPNTKEKMDVTIALQDGELTLNGDIHTMDTLHITVKSINVTNNITAESCTATNIVMDINNKKVTTFSADVDCHNKEMGPLKVKGKFDAESGEGIVEVTDVNGKKGRLKSTGTEGLFEVSFEGVKQGNMDCSMVTLPNT